MSATRKAIGRSWLPKVARLAQIVLCLMALQYAADTASAGGQGGVTGEQGGPVGPGTDDSTASVEAHPTQADCPAEPPETTDEAEENSAADCRSEAPVWPEPEVAAGVAREGTKAEIAVGRKSLARRDCFEPDGPDRDTPQSAPESPDLECTPEVWFRIWEYGRKVINPDNWFSVPARNPKEGVKEGPPGALSDAAGDRSEEASRKVSPAKVPDPPNTSEAEQGPPPLASVRHQGPAKVTPEQTSSAKKAASKPQVPPVGSTVSGTDIPAAGRNRLQPTAAWTERTSPENWFRKAPVVRPPAEEEAPEEYPHLVGYSELNLEYDTTIGESFDDTLVNIRSDIVQAYSPSVFLSSDVRIVFDGEDDGLRTYNTDFPFGGVYVRRLKLQKETHRYALFGGKFEPGSRIFAYAPIFFGNFATDFNLEERAGIGGSVFLDKTETSEQRLTAQAFYLDKSRLSGEIFSGKARNGLTNGQIGDTGRLDNYLITYHGGITNWDPGLRYSLGTGLQRPGHNVEHTERALLASVYNMHRLSDGGDLEFSIDLVNMKNAGGFNQDTDSITLGGGYSDWPEYAGLAYSIRNVENKDDGATRTDRIMELVLRKGIADKMLVEAAYQYSDSLHQVEKKFGIVFRYYSDWGLD